MREDCDALLPVAGASVLWLVLKASEPSHRSLRVPSLSPPCAKTEFGGYNAGTRRSRANGCGPPDVDATEAEYPSIVRPAG